VDIGIPSRELTSFFRMACQMAAQSRDCALRAFVPPRNFGGCGFQTASPTHEVRERQFLAGEDERATFSR
jgi:hypothetical protein